MRRPPDRIFTRKAGFVTLDRLLACGSMPTDIGRGGRDALLGFPKTCAKISFWDYLGDNLAVPGTQATPLSKIILTSPRALAATPLALSQLRSLCPQFIDGIETLPSVFGIVAAEMSVSCRP